MQGPRRLPEIPTIVWKRSRGRDRVTGLAVHGAGDGGLSGDVASHLDRLQACSFLLFVVVWTPCLSTAEESWRVTIEPVL